MARRFFRWHDGEHDTGYQVMTLAWVKNKLLPFDCYIIRYPKGASIPPHRDQPKTTKRHFRINVVLTHPEGGEFKCENPIYQSRWVNIFRPDTSTHSVTEVTGNGTRYVLSVGWLWK